jgi:hypothetical protein
MCGIEGKSMDMKVKCRLEDMKGIMKEVWG